MTSTHRFNPALNLETFAVQSTASAPPSINALYLRDGVYDGMSRADVAATFAAFKGQTSINRFALFFHGGLVDKSSGQQSAANEFDAYKDVAFPLFFIWESGFGEVMSHHLPWIFAETIFGRVLKHSADVVTPKVGARQNDLEEVATPVLTDEDIHTFLNAVQSDPDVQKEAAEIARSSQDISSVPTEGVFPQSMQLSERTMLSPEVINSVRGAYWQAVGGNIDELPFGISGAIQAAYSIAKAAVPVIVNTVRRFANGCDHGLQCTLVEEILRALYIANFGAAVWEEMKKETADAFGPDSNQFGGAAVVEELCALIKSDLTRKVTLVGHSTGGVYIGNFLQNVDRALFAPGDANTSSDIILLAPANTDDFLANAYVPHQVRGIRVFQMKDEVEQQDHLLSKDVGPADPSILGKVYPRSLLYLVSGVCEYLEGQDATGVHAFDGFDMPIMGMERFYKLSAIFKDADYPSVNYLRELFPGDIPKPAFARVLSPTNACAPIGYRSTALKHGNFPGDAPTIESLIHCFQNGL